MGAAGAIGAVSDSDTGGAAGSPTEKPGDTVAGDSCNFTLNYTASAAIGTVEIVTWSTDLPNLTEAHIDFGPTGSEPSMTAPVDLNEPDYRTLLLGMKGARSYSFRILASSGESTCASPDFSFTTGPVPSWVPVVSKASSGEDASKGFIVTTPGVDLNHQGMARELADAYIFDTDGDVVWWVPELAFEPTRAHMAWDGKAMWFLRLNLGTTQGGQVFKVSMDGLTTQEIAGLEAAHHDFTVLPEGGIATMLNGSNDTPDSFVEVKADGSIETVVADLATLYEPPSSFHPNAVHYYPDDDSYTLSDLTLSGFVKFTRSGELVWQLGGPNAQGDSFELVGIEPWVNSHGHHMTADGHSLFFNNLLTSQGGPSRALEVSLDETNWTATKTWEYQDDLLASYQLGDVERLPNGNVLVTYSMEGVIQEVTPGGDVVQSFDTAPGPR